MKGSHKIHTWNLHHDPEFTQNPEFSMFHWKNRGVYILDELENAISPNSIFCFQEVSSESYTSLLKFFLKHNFRYMIHQSHFEPNRYLLTAAHKSCDMVLNEDLKSEPHMRKSFFCVTINNIQIINVHLPMNLNKCGRILRCIASYAASCKSCIVIGDFNSFPNQKRLKQMYHFLRISGAYETTNVMFCDDDDESDIAGHTFSRYPYDRVKMDIVEYPLDHIFIKSKTIRPDVPICKQNVFFIEYDNIMYSISDHFMITMVFEF